MLSDPESSPQVGQVVRITRGRDAGRYAVIIDIEDERFVWIADGDKRKFDAPKKKNIRHLECYDFISSVVRENIQETGRVTNGKLRFAVNKFKETLDAIQEEGE